MKTQNVILGALVLAGLVVMPARAQVDLAEERGPVEPTPANVVSEKALAGLNAFTQMQWRSLQNSIVKDLQTARGESWDNAARSVIILSLVFGDKVDFTAASPSLLNTFLTERDEQRCIMALAAMHLIGDHDTMAYLSKYAKQEPSPRVRRMIRAVLADYTGAEDFYRRRGRIEVGVPVQIPDK